MSRPKPGLWLALPHQVVDGHALADYLRRRADECAGDPDHLPQRVFRTVAHMLLVCGPRDVACLHKVIAVCDDRGEEEDDGPAFGGTKLYWESVAHAVDRIVDQLESAETDAGSRTSR